jgi:ParB-like chromosome segregation protein Spo0J
MDTDTTATAERILRHHATGIELVDPATLVEWPRNPRIITEKAVEHNASLIAEHGWTNPLQVRTEGRMVIAGHVRIRSARLLGLDVVPVLWVDCDEKAAERMALADNPKANDLHATWDEAALGTILGDMGQEGEDALASMGWTESELEALIRPVSLDDVNWKVFDESIGDGVSPDADPEIECPQCAHRFTVGG